MPILREHVPYLIHSVRTHNCQETIFRMTKRSYSSSERKSSQYEFVKMNGLAYLPKLLPLIHSSLVLLISLNQASGNDEDDFVTAHDNSETDLIWSFSRSSTSGRRKQLCESLQPFAHPGEVRIVQGDQDHGYLLFRNPKYLSRSIDTIACLIGTPDNGLKYFYCTQGRGDGSYYLLEEDQDKFFHLGQYVEVNIPEHVPGEVLLKIREEQQRLVIADSSSSRKRRRERIEQPLEKKPNYANWPNVYHRTIWEVDL